MDGFIVVDKTDGMSSHDVVHAVRRITGERKVGHTGTLDPFATGVLPVALGEGTKAVRFLDEKVKEYRAVMHLGESTDTQDATGTVNRRGDWRAITREDLMRVVDGFTGRISQVPPMFSALKRNGVPLYRIARRGGEVPRESREIEIYSLTIDCCALPEVVFSVRCSRGTYVRTLAHDIGERLGCGAHLVRLRRTASGSFGMASALSIEKLSAICGADGLKDIIIVPYDALAHMPDLQVNESGAERVANGIVPAAGDFVALPTVPFCKGEMVRISLGRKLLAVAEIIGEGETFLRFARVFNHAPVKS